MLDYCTVLVCVSDYSLFCLVLQDSQLSASQSQPAYHTTGEQRALLFDQYLYLLSVCAC